MDHHLQNAESSARSKVIHFERSQEALVALILIS